jgi:hypothetical protein
VVASVILRIAGTDIISVEQPEQNGGPHRINAVFENAAGEVVCRIRENEILVSVLPWDVEIIGPTLHVRNGPRDMALSLTSIPGRGFRVDRLDMVHAGKRVRVESNGDLVLPGENRFSRCGFSNGGTAINIG